MEVKIFIKFSKSNVLQASKIRKLQPFQMFKEKQRLLNKGQGSEKLLYTLLVRNSYKTGDMHKNV